MSKITKGMTVRQVVPVIEGAVEKIRYNEDSEQLEYLVKYKGTNGEEATRWFLADQIAAVETPAAE